MKEVIIQVPDDCEIQIVKKEEKKESIIRTYKDIYDSSSNILPLDNNCAVKLFCESTNVTERVAKSMLAMAMISQLMPYYGGEITDEEWSNKLIDKFTIEKTENKISIYTYNRIYHFLSFHTKEQRDEFIKYNEQLVKDYLMID